MAIVENPELFADKFRVKSSRLNNWDYSSPGIYFITICTYNKNNFFGQIIDGQIKLSKIGKIIKQEISKTFKIRKNIKLDEWVIMPNHIHLIIEIKNKINNVNVETHCVRLSSSSNMTYPSSTINPPENPSSTINPPENPSLTIYPPPSSTNNPSSTNDPPTGVNNSLPTGNKRDACNASLQTISQKSNQTIPKIIKLFKASVKSKCNKNNLFFSWQSRFHDRIIRNEKEYLAIKNYIQNNPKYWQKDKDHIDTQLW